MKPNEAGRPRSAVASPLSGANVASSRSGSVAAGASPSTRESPTYSPKHTGPEKSDSVGGPKRRRPRRKLNRVQLAASPGSDLSSPPGSGLSSSSSRGGPASVSSAATPQETSRTIAANQAKEAKTASRLDVPHSVAECKGAAATDLPCKPDEAGPSTKTSALAASTASAKQAGSNKPEHAPRVADIYEALTALALQETAH
ncbi:hypothetical protein MTO96_026585 [Rhipicephalus appendiculatus]